MLLRIFILLLLPIYLYSQNFTGEVNYSGQTESGTIQVISTGYGTNKTNAQVHAEKNALEAILFRGIPGSQQSKPIIPDQETSKKLHSDYFTSLFDSDHYKIFIMESSPLTSFKKRNKQMKNLDVIIKLNITSLISELELKNIIRPFGF